MGRTNRWKMSEKPKLDLVKYGAALEVILVIAEHVIPGVGGILPIGGDHLSQIGATLGVAYAVKEMTD
jgi:hypothetical protein